MSGPEKTKTNAAAADALASEDTAQTLSLMGIGGKPEGLPEAVDLELDAGKPASPKISGGTMIVLMVLVIAGGAIYLMRMGATDLTGGGGSTEAEKRIEELLVKLGKPGAMSEGDPLVPQNLTALLDNSASIQAMFTRDPTQQQVPIEYVKQNPFVMPVEKPAAAAPGDPAPAKPREDVLLKRLQAELKDLKLQSVMDGRVKVALISGKTAQVGQEIGSFTVKAIDGRSVELAAGDKTFTLSLEDKLTPRR